MAASKSPLLIMRLIVLAVLFLGLLVACARPLAWNSIKAATFPYAYQFPNNVSFAINPITPCAAATHTLNFDITAGDLESFSIQVVYPSSFVFNGFDALSLAGTQIGSYGVDFDFDGVIDFTIPIISIDSDTAYADRNVFDGAFDPALDAQIQYNSVGGHTFDVRIPLGGDGDTENIAGPFSERATAVLSSGVLSNSGVARCYRARASFASPVMGQRMY